MNKIQSIKNRETDTENLQITQMDSLSAAGNRLSKIREACGWSINDVSSRLKIPSSKLIELEAGNIEQFPGLPFTIGIVRSYTRMLGIDSDPFVQIIRFEGIDKLQKNIEDISIQRIQKSTGINLKHKHLPIRLRGTYFSYRFLLWSTAIATAIILLAFSIIWQFTSQKLNKKLTNKGRSIESVTNDILSEKSIGSLSKNSSNINSVSGEESERADINVKSE